MPFYVRVGKVPPKRHITFYKEDGKSLYREELFSTKGFSGIYSNKYHLYMPPQVEKITAMKPDIAAEEKAGLPEFEMPEFNLEAEKAGSEELGSPDLDFSGIDLELKDVPEVDEATAPAAVQIDPELWEEVNTKMDLAKAYLEMGDREGAREILQEILSEGDDQQKAEANKLLADTE